MWTSDALRGPSANWRHVGAMFTSNRTALTGHGDTNSQEREFITPEYFGSIPGDLSNTLRVVTNNDGSPTGFGTTMFFLGKQSNGSRFVDKRGRNSWDRAGDTGMLDWGMFAPNNISGTTGLDALKGGQSKWHGRSKIRSIYSPRMCSRTLIWGAPTHRQPCQGTPSVSSWEYSCATFSSC